MKEEIIPLFPLPVVLFPGMSLPLHIFEMRYREMIGQCIESGCPFGLVCLQDQMVCEVGCAARVVDVLKKLPDGTFDILTAGEERFRVVEFISDKAYLEGRVKYFQDDQPTPAESDSDPPAHLIREILNFYSALTSQSLYAEQIRKLIEQQPKNTSFILASRLGFDLVFQQKILEMKSESCRLHRMADFLRLAAEQTSHKPRGRITFGSN